MNTLNDIITYVRRIIKSPSDSSISDNLIIDYINRFYIMDVDARMQLFDLKTQYSFMTTPGVDQYNMPLYTVQSETPNQPTSPDVQMYPVYQGFFGPVYVNGFCIPFYTEQKNFFNLFPNFIQNMQIVGTGNGGAGPYTLNFPIGQTNSTPVNPPIQSILRGHVDISGIIATENNIDPPIADNSDFSILLADIASTSISPSVYITSRDSTGANVVVTDSGVFFDEDVNLGLLINPGKAPFGNQTLPNGYDISFTITGATLTNPLVLTTTTTFQAGQSVLISDVIGMTELNGNTYTILSVTPTTITLNVDSTGFTAYVSGGEASSIQNMVNYLTGTVENLYFPTAIPQGVNIFANAYWFQTGLPRALLYYNNVITLRSPPDQQYLVQLDAYLTPAAFFSTSQAIPFAYMAEYIARGAARKILSDTGDVEQFQFYEPLFKEQELLVWKRSQRQFTSTRTQTIYSQGMNQGIYGGNAGVNNF